jgi:hypothetical protein
MRFNLVRSVGTTACLIFLSAFVVGCSCSKPEKPNPLDVIMIGSGGGISGASSGWRIKRTGEISAWRTMTPGGKESEYASVKTSPDSVDFFFRYLDEIQFNELKLEQVGNMSFYVERSLPTVHRLTWADNPEGGPPEVSVFYRLLMQFASRHLSPK